MTDWHSSLADIQFRAVCCTVNWSSAARAVRRDVMVLQWTLATCPNISSVYTYAVMPGDGTASLVPAEHSTNIGCR